MNLTDGERENGRYRDMVEECMARHVEKFSQCPWPKPLTEGWKDLVRAWTEAFGEHRYGRNKIERAMRTILRKPPSFLSDHLPELLRLLHEHDENYAQPDAHPAQPHEDDEPCDECNGSGLTTIFSDRYKGEAIERVERNGRTRVVPLRITAPCVCSKGRWIFGTWRAAKQPCADLTCLPPGWSTTDPTGPGELPDELFANGSLTLTQLWEKLRVRMAESVVRDPKPEHKPAKTYQKEAQFS